MKYTHDKNLDNPVWFSLNETHNEFSLDYNGTKFYHPDYCPFGGFTELNTTLSALTEYSKLTTDFFIIGEKPLLPGHLKINRELSCLQMILDQDIIIEPREEIIKLKEEHQDELYRLITLVQPGYFKKKTSLLGNYFGIFKNSRLIAVAGERMKMHAFTEVSAIVTHPDYTGKGYGKQLTAHCTTNILNQQKIPYLHVVESNIGAIGLYEKLGFRLRRKMSFWNIVKT